MIGVLRVDKVTTRVRAPNPSWLTLDGTNTYLLGAEGVGAVVVVDPGPDLPVHRTAIESAAAERDAAIAAVVLTHHHADHAQAAGWAGGWGVPALAFDPALVTAPTQALGDGAVLQLAGLELQILHTPGHASDHLCLRVDQTGAVLTGDHVLGRGTTVIAWPDGDMGQYLASLRRLAKVGATALHPGHGPTVPDPAGTVAQYLAHRLEREAEVVAALAAGDETPAQIVVRVYAEVDPGLHPAAERTVRAHLALLVARGQVVHDVDPTRTDREEVFRGPRP